jgi:hypothetical protein
MQLEAHSCRCDHRERLPGCVAAHLPTGASLLTHNQSLVPQTNAIFMSQDLICSMLGHVPEHLCMWVNGLNNCFRPMFSVRDRGSA